MHATTAPTKKQEVCHNRKKFLRKKKGESKVTELEGEK